MRDRRCRRPLPDPAAAALHNLTAGDLDLIVELADGRTVAQLARHFSVHAGTVSRWLGNLRERTGAESSPQLVSWAYQNGVLEVFAS